MASKLCIGVIGVGRIGLQHAEVIREQAGVSEVLLADADASRAEDAAAALGTTPRKDGPRVHASSIDDIFGAADGLVVTTPTATHTELLLRAVQAHLPTFCEKPIALDVPGTRAVIAEVEAAGVPVQIGFQRRFDAGYLAARKALQSGRLGELRRAHLLTCDAAPPAPEFVPASGGIFKDCAIHDVDALRFVSGHDIVEVCAYGVNRGAAFFGASGDVDEAVAIMKLDDDTLASLQVSRYNGAGYDVRMEIAGTKGSMAVGLDEHTALISGEPGVAFPGGTPYPTFYPRFVPAYRAELATFVRVASGEIPPPVGVHDALEALYTCEALGRSRREGRPVRVDEIRAT